MIIIYILIEQKIKRIYFKCINNAFGLDKIELDLRLVTFKQLWFSIIERGNMVSMNNQIRRQDLPLSEYWMSLNYQADTTF
ncbi:hypothetical protein BpHYR1_043694 [Brachionus plicatilis]|uniref:Uncharacterized protein n=1 Tax=Brachionus plicatilis TaxID=10195 RepID=A0A3M7RMT5_BRAPC|nr:hypothetical protein BpHYR1_043694 [Brachionus plicatilis]